MTFRDFECSEVFNDFLDVCRSFSISIFHFFTGFVVNKGFAIFDNAHHKTLDGSVFAASNEIIDTVFLTINFDFTVTAFKLFGVFKFEILLEERALPETFNSATFGHFFVQFLFGEIVSEIFLVERKVGINSNERST